MQKKHYITSLKGIACLLVAFGHFIGVVKYASAINVNIGWYLFLKSCRLDFLVNESFYLYLFFIVSGYLVAHSKVVEFKDLTIRCITRFLRLAIPITAACAIIFVLSKAIPFYSDDTISLFENEWLQSTYGSGFSIVDLVLSPIHVLIFGNAVFNSPYWVLSSMLFASLLIYLASYIKSKIKSDAWQLVFNLILVAGFFFVDKIIFACLIGSLIFNYEEKLLPMLKSMLLMCVLGVLAFATILIHMMFGAILLFAWLVLVLQLMPKVRNVLEVRPLRFLGNISFGIYSFHWPVFCSVGCLIMMKLWMSVGAGVAILLAMLVSVIITFVLAIAFNYLVEKPSEKAVVFVRKKLYMLFPKRKTSK